VIAIDSLDVVWIGSWGSGVIKISGHFITQFNSENSGLPMDEVRCLAIDQYNNKWIGTNGGISVYREGGVFEDVIPPIPTFSNSLQLYPNPFRRDINIKYILAKDSQVNLGIYNVKGQLVVKLEDKVFTKGEHLSAWDGKNNAGKLVSSGLYFCRFKHSEGVIVKKLTVVR
jgi:hypothetical protein